MDAELYQRLVNRFKDNEQEMNRFIVDAIKSQLYEASTDTTADNNDDLESYLQKGSAGSRTYGIKGQGW
ncbi:MAG: hypothetical protein HOL15_03440 [Nitrospinaceae bacterium]|nr:hypothetical protein [Nitrospina sp.]MBT5375847.1 hypothetical protein [Nitrospinaceae bacterium]MBT5868626.1 hypothetical protein [Nitrospinaceae bacterium]MBT6346591.1 hypothetical protein [Nitrospina sp.]